MKVKNKIYESDLIDQWKKYKKARADWLETVHTVCEKQIIIRNLLAEIDTLEKQKLDDMLDQYYLENNIKFRK